MGLARNEITAQNLTITLPKLPSIIQRASVIVQRKASDTAGKKILDDVFLQIQGLGSTANTGPSGSGKTTLLNALSRPPSSTDESIRSGKTAIRAYGCNSVSWMPFGVSMTTSAESVIEGAKGAGSEHISPIFLYWEARRVGSRSLRVISLAEFASLDKIRLFPTRTDRSVQASTVQQSRALVRAVHDMPE